MHMLWGTKPCEVLQRRGDSVLVSYQHPSETKPVQHWVDISEVPTMNQAGESTKALTYAIEDIAVHGTKGIPKLLQALSWWADTQGLRGSLVSQLGNDLREQTAAAMRIQRVFDELDATDVPTAIEAIKDLREELKGVEEDYVKVEAERDKALLEASKLQ